MTDIEKANKLFAELKILVARRIKAEQWFDELTTTDAEREKWNATIFKLNDDICEKVKELESLGLEVDKEIIWYGEIREDEGKNETRD